jgi:hypothetical protein
MAAGISAPLLTPALANRSDQTVVWRARAHVAVAVETMCAKVEADAGKVVALAQARTPR